MWLSEALAGSDGVSRAVCGGTAVGAPALLVDCWRHWAGRGVRARAGCCGLTAIYV